MFNVDFVNLFSVDGDKLGGGLELWVHEILVDVGLLNVDFVNLFSVDGGKLSEEFVSVTTSNAALAGLVAKA